MSSIEKARIGLFLFFSFGIAWLTALVVYLTGGIAGSPVLIPSLKLTLAVVLLATGVMWAPAIAHVLTRLITREGRASLHLQPHFRTARRYWFIAWLAPAVLTLIGGVLFFALFPDTFDPSLGTVRKLLEQSSPVAGSEMPPLTVLVASQILTAVLIAPLINSFFAFGEEFGWRAYLQPKLMSLGPRKAMLLLGAIWGLWHWPIVAMGHNYGTTYAGWPWLGMLAMAWWTTLLGIFIGWLTIRAGSVWPAAIAHGSINATFGLPILFARDGVNPILGPAMTGLVASLPLLILAAWLFARPDAFRSSAQ